jgi:hypothetical protein
MLKLYVSAPASLEKLVQTTRDLKYGEMFGLDLDLGTPEKQFSVSQSEKDLVRFILDGNPYISVLTVHGGEPVLAEQDFVMNGFRCRKKTKFPI